MSTLTPMMAQYKRIKDQYRDCILMYRMGDFYEMFFEDAVVSAKILQITLTQRGKSGGNSAPMCGVPFHALNGYLAKLTRAGKKVAIADQITEPTGKGIVERKVVRIVTPGTTFDDNILDQKSNNYVACISANQKGYGFAYADVTTGDFMVTELKNIKELEAEITRISCAECICEENLLVNPTMKVLFEKANVYAFPFSYNKEAECQLKTHFNVQSLMIFGIEGKDLAVEAAGMLFEYLIETQKTELTHIQKISYYELSGFMALDESCIRNLELLFTSRGGKKEGSLLFALDNTMCSMGGRLLRSWLLHPLLDSEQIENRLNQVSDIKENSSLLREIRTNLDELYDVERLLSRLSLGSGNARDLVAMKMSLKKVPEIKNLIRGIESLNNLSDELCELQELVELIERAINDEAPATIRDGGMIKSGYNTELDDLHSISSKGKTYIKEIQEREINRTGISSLKVKYNRVFGYYIEISNTNLSAVPDDYIRKQTLVNAERFITPELKEYEEKVLNAEEKIKDLEYELFYGVRMEVVKEIVAIQKLAGALSILDVISTFAFNAEKYNYCKPEFNEEFLFEIEEGRHPVVEQLSSMNSFVPNDCKMNNDKRFLLITGPNMGGKSTYLRQVALISLMAQIGSFVPAKSAKLSVVDRIFTRVGASDNLVRGESTFMVEMQEAGYILNHATDKSLIILDEVGRGTSTYDGVSIAWAITEYIHDTIGAKTLFATHYHELIDLADKLSAACNLSVAVRENQQEGVVFLYKIVAGGVDKSYGIEVAKLAGLPLEIISRARGVLGELETKHISKSKVSPDQIGMFSGDRGAKGLTNSQKKIIVEIEGIDTNTLTPLEALSKLDEMKRNFLP